MTAAPQPDLKRSRRAILAGAVGGIGAWAASAIGRPGVTRADGVAITTGGEFSDALTVTGITNTGNSNNVFYATSNLFGTGVSGSSAGGTGVAGTSGSSTGVLGQSGSGLGVSGNSTSSYGLYGQSGSHVGTSGFSTAIDQPATLGYSGGNSTGVLGSSGSLATAKAKTGVYGYANQDNTANGVFGESPAGRAVAGYSSSGYAGYFSGRVFTSRWMEFAEVTTPASPSANRARLFVRDSAGKTQLAVKFPNGTVRVLATEA